MKIPPLISRGLLFTIYILLKFTTPSFSLGQHTIDSLYSKLQAAKEDTSKVKILYNLRDWLFYTNLQESYNYNSKALSLSEKLNFTDGIINGYIFKSGMYPSKGDYKDARICLDKITPLVKQLNKPSIYAYYYNSLSGYYEAIGDYLDAMDYSNKALQTAYDLNDSSLIAKTLETRAQIYKFISDYETSNSYLFEAIKINQKKNNKLRLAANFYQAGLICNAESEDTKALDYFYRSYKIAKETNSTINIAGSLTEIGNIYMKEKQWDKAIDFFNQSIDANETFSDTEQVSTITLRIAMIYCEQGNFDKAIQTALTSLQIAQRLDYKPEIGYAYQYLGEIYMRQKNYAESIKYLNKALAIINTIDEKTSLSSIYNDLAQSYKASNNYQSAYAYTLLDNALKDSVLRAESLKKTVEMGALFNSDKKDKEIALLTKDKKIQDLEIKKQATMKYFFIGGLFLICLSFIFLYRNYRIRQKLNMQELRNKIAIDLHDEVGSTLSSIKIFSEIARRHSKELTPTLDQIIEYSHKMLESMADIVWSINPENDNFEKIILRMRSFAFELLGAKNIDFEFTVDNSLTELKLTMEERKNLYLIFKEAINNMIKYSDANRAMFSISNANNELAMLIRDNGKGFDVTKETQGNGLKNMKKRAGEIGAKLFIESETGIGTTVQLLITT